MRQNKIKVGGGNMKTSVRFSTQLFVTAERVGLVQKRSAPKQIEYWAELGRAIDPVLRLADVYAIRKGIKTITVEAAKTAVADPNDVFQSLEKSRESGELAKNVTKSRVYYEASLSKPGLLDRVDPVAGERQSGVFKDGVFKTQE